MLDRDRSISEKTLLYQSMYRSYRNISEVKMFRKEGTIE
jgi:hypothetical protein